MVYGKQFVRANDITLIVLRCASTAGLRWLSGTWNGFNIHLLFGKETRTLVPTLQTQWSTCRYSTRISEITTPALENSRSDGTEEADTANMSKAIPQRTGYVDASSFHHCKMSHSGAGGVHTQSLNSLVFSVEAVIALIFNNQTLSWLAENPVDDVSAAYREPETAWLLPRKPFQRFSNTPFKLEWALSFLSFENPENLKQGSRAAAGNTESWLQLSSSLFFRSFSIFSAVWRI